MKLIDLTEGEHIVREMMLIKVKASDHREQEDMKRLSDIFRANVIDVSDTTYTIEVTGSADKLDAFVAAIDVKSIIEVVRSGVSGIGRGSVGLKI